ncbi:MAG: ribonuclease III, partial [Ignavibacteriaceae bacterium]
KLKQREEQESSKYISKLFTEKKYKELQQLIGSPINNRSYFIQALMHRSFLEQNEEYEVSNERLEYLGDSVLSLAAAEYLFDSFPEKDEGFLTKVRAKLVNRFALAEAAENINLADFLLVSENLSSGFLNNSKTVLSDALEALIGAIYLDSGLETAKNFINKILIEPNTKAGLYLIDENYKSQLLEFAQANKLEIPTYEVVKEDGPQHNRIFTIRVLIGNTEYGIGNGRNKKSAEQDAAQTALEILLNKNEQ